MPKDIINTLSDGVELAIYLQEELRDSTEISEKRKQIKYLGQCLGAMMEQISDFKQRRDGEDTNEP
jgi:hypothetical protein